MCNLAKTFTSFFFFHGVQLSYIEFPSIVKEILYIGDFRKKQFGIRWFIFYTNYLLHHKLFLS